MLALDYTVANSPLRGSSNFVLLQLQDSQFFRFYMERNDVSYRYVASGLATYNTTNSNWAASQYCYNPDYTKIQRCGTALSLPQTRTDGTYACKDLTGQTISLGTDPFPTDAAAQGCFPVISDFLEGSAKYKVSSLE